MSMTTEYEFITMTKEEALSIIALGAHDQCRDAFALNKSWSQEKVSQFNSLFPASKCQDPSSWTDEEIMEYVKFLLDI
jgi:hypothetical protein